MLEQYLMSRITDANISAIVTNASGSAASLSFQIPMERQCDFFHLVCDSDKALEFLNAYAPVDHSQ